MGKLHGGQMVVRALSEERVAHVFSIGGGHIAHISDALLDSDIGLYDTRHEQAAVMMAEAQARLTGHPGVALVTAGPGFTNALTGVANAAMAGVPLVIIAGVVPTNMVGKLDLQEMDQLSVVKPMVKWARRVENAERIPAAIHEAMTRARSGKPGPVYVEIPADVLGQAVDEQFIEFGRVVVPSPPAADPAAVRAAAEMIAAAQRPVIVAGSGVWFSQAMDELRAFVEATGLPCFTSSMGKGCLADSHECCYGPSLPIRPGAALMGMVRSDCVVLCGTRVSLFYAHGRLFAKDAKIICINIDPEESDRNRPADLALIGDCGRALGQLREELKGKGAPSRLGPWRKELDAAAGASLAAFQAQRDSEQAPIHPARLMKEIDQFLTPDDVLTLDGGDTSVWMNMVRTNARPAGSLESGLFGCLGVGLPFAVSAKLAAPERRVFAIVGDGSLGFNFMEFHTAIRFNLPVIVIVNNDQAWGMVRHSQQLRFGMDRTPGSDLGYVPYHKLVEALGGYGEEVTKPGDIRPALTRAAASGKTACINVVTERDVISPGSIALAAIGKRDLPMEALQGGGGAY
ncbi:MAG TPA: thiamine pyrophosphate-binding protein [bacterium]|nr:thiamine pyrophosphate-binding protein [bacterium]